MCASRGMLEAAVECLAKTQSSIESLISQCYIGHAEARVHHLECRPGPIGFNSQPHSNMPPIQKSILIFGGYHPPQQLRSCRLDLPGSIYILTALP